MPKTNPTSKAKTRAKTADAPTRREKQMETGRLVTGAALSLFQENGYEATTTKAIAERAGVAHGTVFLVAPSKEGLLVAALREHLRDVLLERQRSLPPRDVVAQLTHVVRGLFDFYVREPSLSRVFLAAVMFSSDPIAKALHQEHIDGFVARLALLIDAAKARGEVPENVDARAFAEAVLGVYVVQLVKFLGDSSSGREALDDGFHRGLRTLFPEAAATRRRTASRPRA